MYIDVCTGVRCKVCDERGRGRGEGVSMSAAVKVKSLNPLAEVGGRGGGGSTNNERPGNHPNSTKIQH